MGIHGCTDTIDGTLVTSGRHICDAERASCRYGFVRRYTDKTYGYTDMDERFYIRDKLGYYGTRAQQFLTFTNSAVRVQHRHGHVSIF